MTLPSASIKSKKNIKTEDCRLLNVAAIFLFLKFLLNCKIFFVKNVIITPLKCPLIVGGVYGLDLDLLYFARKRQSRIKKIPHFGFSRLKQAGYPLLF